MRSRASPAAGKVDDETWDELEEALILADVGVPTTTKVIDAVRERASAEKTNDPDRVIELLREELVTLLSGSDRELQRAASGPSVWMFVGVNGVGKTTSIAKLAQREVDAGHRVVLAAADTFRAAAAEQLATWAERTGSEIVRGQDGADPGSIVFDAMSAAATRGADVVLVDTAGRLHNKVNLMEELKKLRRIVDRTEGALCEVLLVVDASTGQNGLTQARQFAETVDITGIVLTKLDGTAKGGIVLAIQSELGISGEGRGRGRNRRRPHPLRPRGVRRRVVLGMCRTTWWCEPAEPLVRRCATPEAGRDDLLVRGRRARRDTRRGPPWGRSSTRSTTGRKTKRPRAARQDRGRR